MNTIIRTAAAFASKAHASINQRRKYTGEPYIRHPAAVAAIAWTAGLDDEAIAAAWLHDVVEDTPVTISEIEQIFGQVVATYVDFLTDKSTPADGGRAARKAFDRARLVDAPRAVKSVKLADLIHNSLSIIQHDPDFAHVYLREKLALLEVLKDGNEHLWRRARALVSAGMNAIDQHMPAAKIR